MNRSSPVFGSGEDKTSWYYVDVMSDFNCFAALLVSVTVRNKRTAQAERLSAITVALQYESDEEGILSGISSPQHCNTCRNYTLWLVCHDVFTFLLQLAGSVHYDEGESEAESMTSNMDMSNPIFQLYEAVRGARNSQGQLISEPFLQLPSRKDYPDYYQQISQPICLHQIKYELTLSLETKRSTLNIYPTVTLSPPGCSTAFLCLYMCISKN